MFFSYIDIFGFYVFDDVVFYVYYWLIYLSKKFQYLFISQVCYFLFVGEIILYGGQDSMFVKNIFICGRLFFGCFLKIGEVDCYSCGKNEDEYDYIFC